MIVLDLLRKRLPDIPVLFLDTGYHFAETYAYRDRMARDMEFECAESRGEAIRCRSGSCSSAFSIAPIPADAAICAKSSRSSARLRNIDVWFTGPAPRAIAHAQESESCRAPRTADRQSAAESQPARRVDLGPSLGIYVARIKSIICRSTTPATAASAASRAPRFPPQAPIRVRAAGAERSSSAAFTLSRSGPIDAIF